MAFWISISKFWPLGEGFRGFGPQIRLQHAEISPGCTWSPYLFLYVRIEVLVAFLVVNFVCFLVWTRHHEVASRRNWVEVNATSLPDLFEPSRTSKNLRKTIKNKNRNKTWYFVWRLYPFGHLYFILVEEMVINRKSSLRRTGFCTGGEIYTVFHEESDSEVKNLHFFDPEANN